MFTANRFTLRFHFMPQLKKFKAPSPKWPVIYVAEFNAAEGLAAFVRQLHIQFKPFLLFDHNANWGLKTHGLATYKGSYYRYVCYYLDCSSG